MDSKTSNTDAHETRNRKFNRSKHWPTMVALVDKFFPKGVSKSRGEALVFLAHIEMMLKGTKFDANGDPVEKKSRK